MNEEKVRRNVFLVFRLDKRLFGIEVGNVLEVLEKQEIIEVPNAPDMISGVINFRGDILPVINTGKKFGNPDYEASQKFVIIILEIMLGNKTFRIGAIADFVIDVIEILENAIKPVPEMGGVFNPLYLKGIHKTESEFIMLLNVNEVFSDFKIHSISDVK